MTAPDYVAQAAELLTAHAMCSVRGERMYCGMDLPARLGDATFTAAHLAEVLAAAGLIPTSTEWGSRMTWDGPKDPTRVPRRRGVTDWKDAT